MARFITTDPISILGGTNPYRYVPDPFRWVDPLGLQGVDLNLLPGHAFGYYANYGNDVLVVLSHAAGGDVVLSEGNTIIRTVDQHELAGMMRSLPNYKRGKTFCFSPAIPDQRIIRMPRTSYDLDAAVLGPNGDMGVEMGLTGPVAPVLSSWHSLCFSSKWQ